MRKGISLLLKDNNIIDCLEFNWFFYVLYWRRQNFFGLGVVDVKQWLLKYFLFTKWILIIYKKRLHQLLKKYIWVVKTEPDQIKHNTPVNSEISYFI